MIYPEGKRCGCQFQLLFMAQCKHELEVDGEFCADKFHLRWYNSKYLQENHIQGIFTAQLPSNDNLDGALSDDNNTIEENDSVTNEDYLPVEDILETLTEKITYSSVKARCEELLNIVSSNSIAPGKVHETIERSIIRARKGLSLRTQFAIWNTLEDERNNLQPLSTLR